MERINLREDVKSLSEFRQNVTSFIHHIEKTHRPLLITQHGEGKAVLLSVADYEDMTERFEVLQDIQAGADDIREGRVYTTEQVKKDVLGSLRKKPK
jgi:prevent-host-death family protein